MAMRRVRGFACLVMASAITATGMAVTALASAGGTPAPAIQNGGTLVVGLASGPPSSLDPDLGGDFSSGEVLRTICESLYQTDASSNPVPLLASALPTTSPDKLTVTIPLRKGILFNDGTPFNADAVVEMFQRDLTLPGSSRRSVLAPVSSVNATGPYTVQLHLSSPDTPIGQGLVKERPMSPAQLASLGANFGSDPVCVGPFMFDSAVAGQSVTVVRSPYYYDKQDVHLEKIVFQSESNSAAAIAALEAGDIQALDSVDPTELESVKQNGFRLIGSLSLAFDEVAFNIGNVNGTRNPYSPTGSPVSNPLIRNAFELAIDRRTMNRVVFGGQELPGCTPISPADVAWYAKLPCTPYDPAQARRLVQEAGIGNPTVQLLYPSAGVDQLLAQFIQAEEAQVGINVVLSPADLVTAISAVNAGSFQAFLVGSVPPKADPDWLYGVAMQGNTAGYVSPRINLLVSNARKAIDPKARLTLYTAAQEQIMADRPFIVLDHEILRAAVVKSLVGVQMYPDAFLRVAFAGYRAGT
jgi:peptide/nickel transport system substrate-binding protein